MSEKSSTDSSIASYDYYDYRYQYPGPFPLVPNNFATFPQPVMHPAPGRWEEFDPFDEEDQQRRKKGKELVPARPVINGPLPPWTAYPGGYGMMPYGPLDNPFWNPVPQRAPLPLPLLPGELEYPSKKPPKHVRHHGQQPGSGEKNGAGSPDSGIMISREVDGILTPDSGDLTVHLTMDLEEDLEHHLDELNRLSRLGHFSLAKELFKESLQHHIDNPYVLVQYADLLLHQGDLKGVTLLKDDAMYERDGEQSNSGELKILRVNWELIQILAKSRTLDTLSGASTVFEEAISVLGGLAKGSSSDRQISSTEIEILALTLRLTGHPVLHSKWLRSGSRALAAFTYPLLRLYQTLLRQGRIWDFHDLMVLMPTMEDIKALTYDVFKKDLIPSLETMVSDWSDSVHGYDASTTLGLLGIMTHILLEPICLPLAISVVENDPASLKSRSYLRLLLAKSRFAETASRQAMDSLTTHLQSSQGIFYQADIALLPVYLPSGNETPQWTPMDQPAELKGPVKLVLRSAIELGDLETEVLARRELIRLSAEPRNEFDTLCTLQLSRQGDLNNYGLTLASKYLVTNTNEAREDLAISISRLLSRIASPDYWDSSHEWILNMLLYKLEGRSPSTIQHMLERSHSDYRNIEESLLREISRKMPALKDWVDQQQPDDSAQTKLKDTVLRTPAGGRTANKPVPKSTKSSMDQRASGPPPRRERRRAADDREKEVPLMTGPNLTDAPQDQGRRPGGSPPPAPPVVNEQEAIPNMPGPEANVPMPMMTPIQNFEGNPQERHVASPGTDSIVIHVPPNDKRNDEAILAAQIRERLDAEYNEKIEAEKEYKREQQKERMAILEGLKQGKPL
ncbi:hypothetical protein F4802DRAFT_607316 [Xylaria palmicola]|nr:hypothetical protein F4802DRAFT_607316 [Xylaria palmicola]